jgi:hypothetical protein
VTQEARSAAQPRGVTVHAWLDFIYYDGLLSFAQGCYAGQGPVVWMGEPLPRVEASRVG